MANDYILTLSCPDKPGIVHAVTGIFASRAINTLELQQFSDPVSKKFFMRVHFGPTDSVAEITEPFNTLAADIQHG